MKARKAHIKTEASQKQRFEGTQGRESRQVTGHVRHVGYEVTRDT